MGLKTLQAINKISRMDSSRTKFSQAVEIRHTKNSILSMKKTNFFALIFECQRRRLKQQPLRPRKNNDVERE